MRFFSIIAAGAIAMTPHIALAAGGDGPEDDAVPKPSGSKKCLFGRVWDEETGKCVKPSESSLSDDAMINAVRDLAYAGKFAHAQAVLAAMPDQMDDRVLTYWGFTHRKLGDLEKGRAFYGIALQKNPDNLLTRSYLGQSYVETGDLALAQAQLIEIRARGGSGTWPEISLANAIRDGVTYNY